MRISRLRRREFITLLGGAAAAWPLVARAQQPERVRRVGVLMGVANDAEGQARIRAFQEELQHLGWVQDRNIRLDYRWGAGEIDRYRAYSAELVALAPDVILATNTPTTQALKRETTTIPIVFVSLSDAVGSGVISNLAIPEGNVTGFTNYEYSLAGKWLGLLRDVAPRVARVAIMFNPSTAPFGPIYLRSAEDAARSFGGKITAADVQSAAEIERAIIALAEGADGGLIVLPDSFMTTHREQIIALVARHRVPTMYFARYFVIDGGLMSYGPDFIDQYQRAASYIDRILRGAKVADLPVQVPTKFNLVVNLKLAKAHGLAVAESFLLTADEVIE
jgi:putative ABC transport system substrate-binding protein